MDGYMCQFNGCLHCTTTPGAMKEHCRVKHERKKWDEEMWRPRAIQTFFQAQHCKYDYLLSQADSRYFPITVESDADPTLIQNLITNLLDSAQTDGENHQRELNNVPKNSELATLTPCLRHTRWHKTFAGRVMEQLVKLTEKPDLNDHIMF